MPAASASAAAATGSGERNSSASSVRARSITRIHRRARSAGSGVGGRARRRPRSAPCLGPATSGHGRSASALDGDLGRTAPACSHVASPRLYSSSSAQIVTATVTRSALRDRLVEREAPAAQQRAQVSEPLDDGHSLDRRRACRLDLGRHPQQPADRSAQQRRVVDRRRLLERSCGAARAAAARCGSGSRTARPGGAQVLGGAAVAVRLQQAREQLLGRLAGLEVEQLLAPRREHQARLQLQQRGDQHEELGRQLEVQLAARLQAVDVGEDDVGEVDLEQVDLLAQDERQQQVERPGEDVEVEVQVGGAHRVHGGTERWPTAGRRDRPPPPSSASASRPTQRRRARSTVLDQHRGARQRPPLRRAAIDRRARPRRAPRVWRRPPRLRPDVRPDAHRARTSRSTGAASARAFSAPAASTRSSAGLVGAQLLVALADGRRCSTTASATAA